MKGFCFATSAGALALVLLGAIGGGGCRAIAPENAPVSRCQKNCVQSAKQCSERECTRGCEFILDRLVEREDGNVVRCVATKKTKCGDRLWAYCAARIGVHADGGPPVPPGLPDDEWD